ncbi:MAG: RNA polymerase sigma factor [Myxococcales bacterium]|nr:RNA polymerase sigma factor [Myxococcales bacterium]
MSAKTPKPPGLLERCQRGEQLAWRELFSKRAADIYRWAVLLGLDPSEAEDAAQDVLVTAARRIDRCEAEAALTSWLYQITRRIVANRRRGSWLRRWLPGREVTDADALSEPAFEHDGSAAGIAFELDTRRCLQRMPDELAELLVMVEIVGLTRDEAASVLGLPAGTVASRLRRAREQFRQHWQHDDADVVLGKALREGS